MKNFQMFFLASSLFVAPIFLAQRSPTKGGIAVECQRLSRHIPMVKAFKGVELDGVFEADISVSTLNVISTYMLQHFDLGDAEEGRSVCIYKLPESEGLYLVQATRSKGDDPTFGENLLLIIRVNGGAIDEVRRSVNDYAQSIPRPFWGDGSSRLISFIGENRLLIVVSMSADDGSFYGNAAFEYTNKALKSLGGIDVYDLRVDRWPPKFSATAEYSVGAYYITLKGQGDLYRYDTTSSAHKRLSRRGVPLKYFFDGTTWRPVPIGPKRRR